MRAKVTLKSKRQLPVLLCGISLMLMLAGCLTVEQMAPHVSPEFTKIAESDTSLAVLQLGREVYVQDCTHCHSVEPIGRYSKDRWTVIIERMGFQSKLEEPQIEALRAYILTAHNVLAQQNLTK